MMKKLALAMMMMYGTVNANSFDSVLSNGYPGRWNNGEINWYYNSANAPAGTVDNDIINLFTNAFASWSSNCNLKVTYAGTTTISIDDMNIMTKNKVIVGWSSLVVSEGFMDAYPFLSATNNTSAFVGGLIRINAKNTFDYVKTNGKQASIHEVGHLLGLYHSDNPNSIMFAAPYTTITDIVGDDVQACASLYGAKGVKQENYVNLNAQVNQNLGITGYLFADNVQVSNSTSTATLNVDMKNGANTATYAVLNKFPNTINTGNTYFRAITPSGKLREMDTSKTLAEAKANTTAVTIYFNENGLWKIQSVLNNEVSSTINVNVTNANGYQKPADLEYALIVETTSSGFASRMDNYSGVPILMSSSYLNRFYNSQVGLGKITDGFSIVPIANTNNELEVWLQTNQPRYVYDFSKRIGGNDGSVYNSLRNVHLTTNTTGKISADSINYTETGTNVAYWANGEIQISQTGKEQIFVAVYTQDGKLLFKTKDGWTSAILPLTTVTAPASVNFNIFSDVLASAYPAGTSVYIGFGTSIDDLLAKNQVKLVKVF